MSTAARPGGRAADPIGALAGDYPDQLAIGAPNLFGHALVEDWVANDSTTRVGAYDWQVTTSGTGSVIAVTPTAASGHEHGLLEIRTTTAGAFRWVHTGLTSTRALAGNPPPGSLLVVKQRHLDSTSAQRLWVGLISASTEPDTALANNVDCVGFRSSLGGNWHGVVRNGTSETTVDLGIAPSTSDDGYAVLAFLRTINGYRFYVADAAPADAGARVTLTQVGAEITTNLPNEPLAHALATLCSTATSCGMVSDFYNFGGRCRRF